MSSPERGRTSEPRFPDCPMNVAQGPRVAAITLLLAVLALPTGAVGQSGAGNSSRPSEQEELVRCWWRTSVGAVRVGESFVVVLTCAVVDTGAVRVVPDESRLDPSVVVFPPFDVLEGRRGTDLATDQHRFFQYEYTLRLIAEDYFGRDVELPAMSLSYRVQSSMETGEVSEGRDQSYELPVQSIRIVSLVTDDANGIREGLSGTFWPGESRLFRGTVLRFVGVVFLGLAALMTGGALIGLVRRRDVGASTGKTQIPDWVVRRGVGRELAAIQQQRTQTGWTPELVERALGAVRIVAGYRLGLPVTQRPTGDGEAGDGGALRVEPWWPGRKPVLVSSSVTAESVVDVRSREAEADAGSSNLAILEELKTALTSLTAVAYGREEIPSEAVVLDTSVATGLDELRRMNIDAVRRFGRPSAMASRAAAADPDARARSR